MGLHLGIDVGTTNIAAVVVDATTGRQIATASAPEPGPLLASATRSEWDAAAIINQSLAVGRAAVALLDHPGEIAAIGVTGQQHGMVLVSTAPGDNLRPLTPFISWQDKRCDELLDDFPSTIAQMRQRMGQAATERTGCQVASGFMGAILFWLAQHGRLPTDAALATFMPDLLVARLCAQLPVTDPTNAASAGVFDVVNRRWDDALLSTLVLPANLFPVVHPTGALVGRLSGESAVALGLTSGLPVMNGLGDNQASCFGSVGASTSDVLVNVGTGGQVSAIVERFMPGESLETRPYLGDNYLLVGSNVAGGRAYAIVRDFIRQVGRAVFNSAGPDDFFPMLNELAASVPPGSNGLRIDPRFGSDRFNPDQRGSITGIDAANFTPAHLAHATLEGMVETYYNVYSSMLAVGVAHRTRLIGSGNGIRRNPLLAELLGAAFGLPLISPEHTEEAAHGAALLAAVATGELTLADATARIAHTVIIPKGR